MSALPAPTRLDDEARLDLLAVTADRERRNRPLWLVFVGVALILASFVYLLSAWSVYAAARGQLAEQREQLNAERTLSAEIVAADAARSDPALLEQLAPDTGVVGRLEALATEVGLTGIEFSNAPENVERLQQLQGLTRRKFDTNFKDQRAAALLQFIDRAAGVSKGLQLKKVQLTGTISGPPDAEGKPTVSGSLTFTRWERAARPAAGN